MSISSAEFEFFQEKTVVQESEGVKDIKFLLIREDKGVIYDVL